MKNYSVFDTGKFQDLEQHIFSRDKLPFALPGKLFLREKLELTGMEVSLNKMSPDISIPFLHRHRQSEELYIFLSGEGQLQVDNEIIPVSEGTTIRVAPAGERVLRNTSDTDLIFIVIQAPAGGFDIQDINDGEAVNRPVQW